MAKLVNSSDDAALIILNVFSREILFVHLEPARIGAGSNSIRFVFLFAKFSPGDVRAGESC